MTFKRPAMRRLGRLVVFSAGLKALIFGLAYFIATHSPQPAPLALV